MEARKKCMFVEKKSNLILTFREGYRTEINEKLCKPTQNINNNNFRHFFRPFPTLIFYLVSLSNDDVY